MHETLSSSEFLPNFYWCLETRGFQEFFDIASQLGQNIILVDLKNLMVINKLKINICQSERS